MEYDFTMHNEEAARSKAPTSKVFFSETLQQAFLKLTGVILLVRSSTGSIISRYTEITLYFIP